MTSTSTKPVPLTPDNVTALAEITALNNALPPGHRYTAEIQMVKLYMTASDPAIRALATNALTRLRSKLER